MKFYISSRAKKSNRVRTLAEKLKAGGHKITLDWTSFKNLQPYDKNPIRSSQIASQMLKAIRGCDVFVLLTDKAGTGMYAEFGYALAHHKRVFIVGKHLNNSIFFFYPKVKIVNSIDDLMKEM